MAITRRQFLKRTSLATAGAVVGPSIFRNPLLRNALAASDKYLIIFYLDGGNDGLNTITPADNGMVGMGGLRDLYEGARGTGPTGIRLPATGTGSLAIPTLPMIDTNTGSQLGFHPGLQGLVDMYDQGNVAVVQNVGYPEANLSHDESGRKWETGDPFGVLGTNGWLGRYLAANFDGNEIPGVNLRDNVAGEFLQGTTGVLALRRVTDFAFPYGQGVSDTEKGFLAQAFEDIHNDAAAAGQTAFSYTGSTGFLAQQATTKYPFLDTDYVADRPTFDADYTALNSESARRLREIAKVIYGVANNTYPGIVTARYFETRQGAGSYDTHTGQGNGVAGAQLNLFNEMSQAIKLFFEDISDMQPGLASKVTILVWSEFSRRITQNDSGTDHGTQGPVFLIGGAVNGGVHGNHPNLDNLDGDGNTIYSQTPGDGFRTTDLRDVYGTLLRHYLDVADPTIFLPVDSGDVNLYWTLPEFDLPLFL